MLRYPLKIFGSRRNTEKEIKFYKEIIAKFKELISKWKRVQIYRGHNHRGCIQIGEESILYELVKKAYSMEDLHIYTRIYVQKYCSLAVVLVEMTVNYGIKERKELQAFSK